ncbi:MAG: replication protein [Sphingobacteriales bacterium JAD_PAG50586_3]|nr:MAG: replication protein [Sphingobacteriales bacterium JAD_PAG50586_3]
MNYQYTTQVPNRLFDHYLPTLTFAELKILLFIVRQTYGWIDRYTGKRKIRDCISYRLFINKTGLSRRILTESIQSLIDKKAVIVTDFQGTVLTKPQERLGKSICIIQLTCFYSQ